MKGDFIVKDNFEDDENSFSSEGKEERKPFIHPLLLVLIFLLLLVTFSVFGLYTSLKEKTRPKANENGITTPSPAVTR